MAGMSPSFSRRLRAAAAAVAVIVGTGAASPAGAEASDAFGVWRNPKNSVHVEIRDCGAAACGYVVWASAKAQADARKGGTENLVGLQLLRDFVEAKNGELRGRVFVPDLNITISGSALRLDDNTLRARGCLVRNVVCKSQTWTRVDGARS